MFGFERIFSKSLKMMPSSLVLHDQTSFDERCSIHSVTVSRCVNLTRRTTGARNSMSISNVSEERITVRLPQDLLRKVEAIAKPQLISVSDVVRQALLLYFEQSGSNNIVAQSL